MIAAPSPSQIIQICESGNAEDALQWFREQSDRSLWFFNKIVLNYPDLSVGFHMPMCEWLTDTEDDLGRGLLAPRKFLKSTCVKGYLLRRIVRKPEIRILFVGENEPVGKKNLTDIKWNIQENLLFRAMYPHVIPPDNGSKWSETQILVPRARSFDEPTVTAIGIGAKHTGFHYDFILYDDPIGLVAASSPPEMQAAIEWFKAAPGLLNSADSEELIVGTRWKHGKADLYGWVMDELPFKRTKEGREGFKWYIRSCIENDVPTWPERYPLHVLEAMRRRQKTYLFNANMMNNPTAKEGTDFPADWIQSYTISEDRKHLILEGTGEIVPLASLLRISIYDPSAGGQMAEAENAIIGGGMDIKGRIFALEAWSKKCGFGLAIEKWHEMNDHWHFAYNFYEAVGAHKAVAEIIRTRESAWGGVCQFPTERGKVCGKHHGKLRPKELVPDSRTKEERILALAQPAFEELRVFIGAWMQKLRTQIESFPHGDLVDLFDVLAYLISKLRRPTRSTDEEQTQEREAKERARKHEPRTHAAVDYGGYS